MIDQKAVEAAKRILDYWDVPNGRMPRAPHSQDEVAVARALLTASQARDEIVEGIKATFLASTIEGPCVWVSFETTQCAERFIASLKTMRGEG